MLVLNKEYNLWVPEFDKRLMEPHSLHKTMTNIGANLMTFIANTKKFDMCVQAGGNLGIWPNYLASFFKVVYTFEPDPVLFECIQRNKKENVIPIKAALSNELGKATFHRCGGALVGTITPDEHYSQKIVESFDVAVVSLDRFLQYEIDAIQLDIERNEYNALLGAERIIRHHRPVLQLEIHDSNRDQLNQLTEAMGYKSLGPVNHRDHVFVGV